MQSLLEVLERRRNLLWVNYQLQGLQAQFGQTPGKDAAKGKGGKIYHNFEFLTIADYHS